MNIKKQNLFMTILAAWLLSASSAHAYLGKMEIFDRDGKMAKEACETKDLHAGYEPAESAAAQQRDKELDANNAKTKGIGNVQAGQGQNEEQKNKTVSAQAKSKAQACRNAYERCMQAAEIENKVYGAEGKKADALGLGGWKKNREELAEKAKKSGEKCKEYSAAADKADQQAASNDSGASLNNLVQAANSLGSGGSGGGGGSQPTSKAGAPVGGGGSNPSGGNVAGGSTKLVDSNTPSPVKGNSSLAGSSGVVGAFSDELPPIVAAGKAASGGSETAKGGRAGVTGASGTATNAAANKFSLQGGRGEMAGSGAGGPGGGVSGEMRSGGGRGHSDSEIAQAGAMARSRAQRALGGMSLKAVDGITGPTGPSLFEKVSSSFQRLTPDLYAAPEDLPPPPPADP